MKKTKSTQKQPTPNPFEGLKVAIVHDWLTGGGAERVVYELHQMFPDAPIYTSYATREWRRKLGGRVKTGWLQYWPFSRLRKFLPVLRILWFSRLKLKGYDLVISSSGAEAKGISVPKGTLHVNYCHAPTHYYWSRYAAYMDQPGFGPLNPLARFGLWLLVGPLRDLDWRAAQKPDYIIANSTYTKSEIKKYYGRDSDVVFPPVDIERFAPDKSATRFGYVIAGRQTPYKRIDLAVAACSKINAPLKVIGKGPDHDRLAAMAGQSVRFLTNVSDDEMLHHFQHAAGFIFPGTDDFGIVAVEAMAAGTPVIAYKDGGAIDYVIEGKTGTFFAEQTVDSLTTALRNFDKQTFHTKQVIKHTQKFSSQNFHANMHRTLRKILQK